MDEVVSKAEKLQLRYFQINKEISSLQALVKEEEQKRIRQIQETKERNISVNKKMNASFSNQQQNSYRVNSSFAQQNNKSFYENSEYSVFMENEVPNTSYDFTPVHDRLFNSNAQRKAKLDSLREQIEVKTCQSNTPKINESSRRIVENSRKRASSLPDHHHPHSVNTISKSDSFSSLPTIPVWREHATSEGYIYYYNEVTKETTWEKPSHAVIVPYKRKFSLDQAKQTLKAFSSPGFDS